MSPLSVAPARLVRMALAVLLAALAPLSASIALAHDASAWGGLFRSRDNGSTWFQANQGRLVSGALSVAISPTDPDTILLGTDTGLLVTHNGGRDWAEPALDMIGQRPLLAAVLDADGQRALVATDQGIYRSDDGSTWQALATPTGASPTRALVRGRTAGEAYLVGWHGLFRSADWGVRWDRVDAGLPEADASALIVLPDVLLANVDGTPWASVDEGRSWAARPTGLPAHGVQTMAWDPLLPSTVWAGGAGGIFRSDDRGLSWQPVGQPLPERDTEIRGIVADPAAGSILVSTHRGLYLSTTGGATWTLLADALPGHLEAGPLARNPHQPSTVYVGFALTPYSEQWARATEGRATGALTVIELLGAVAFLLLLALASGLALQWLARERRRQRIAAVAGVVR